MIKEWIAEYNPVNQQEAIAALREIMQEVALAGLQRSGFFEQAAFYGGTALRILYGLDRYSEDLDFSLLEQKKDFSLEPYLNAIKTEFAALGMKVSISEKIKSKATKVDSAFLKSETIWKELILEGVIPQNGLGAMPSLKIKIEVDTQPPLGFKTEEKLLLRPFSFYVKCFTAPDLFAGKMHALLFRKWKNRVKGRDWYDFEWYVRKGIPLHLAHFVERAIDSRDITEYSLTPDSFKQLLLQKINSVTIDQIKVDINPFIKDSTKLNIWSTQYFVDLVQKLKFTK